MSRPRILLVNGPNLNLLGRREPSIYGTQTLADIESMAKNRAESLGLDVTCFQSNHEGAIIDFLQAEADTAAGLILNAGALSHYGLSLRDALGILTFPIIEVHLSNIHAREEWRRHSVTAEVARGVIAGLKGTGYVLAVEALAGLIFASLRSPE